MTTLFTSSQYRSKQHRVHRIQQIQRWRNVSPKATVKHVQKLQNRVCHIDPWPDLTRQKLLTHWPVTWYGIQWRRSQV